MLRAEQHWHLKKIYNHHKVCVWTSPLGAGKEGGTVPAGLGSNSRPPASFNRPPYLNKSATLSACPGPRLPSMGVGVGLEEGRGKGVDNRIISLSPMMAFPQARRKQRGKGQQGAVFLLEHGKTVSHSSLPLFRGSVPLIKNLFFTPPVGQVTNFIIA